jgi:short-subunit dehydrogenase
VLLKKLEDSVAVITGASSGIGRAAALELAQRAATVVLAARRQAALEELAEECRRYGARALAIPIDVSDEQAVKNLARQIIENFGRIDLWVNNAAVTVFGHFEEVPIEVARRVIEVNLLGYIHGARAVIPYFREQNSGVLINVASQVSVMGEPFVAYYVVTKFAIRGLGECLRQELRDTKIDVCTLLPAAIDTPFYQQGANYMGKPAKPLNPIYDAAMVARDIVKLAQHPRREMHSGASGKLASLAHTIAPGTIEKLAARKIEKEHFENKPAPPSAGNLFQPMPEFACISGGWQARESRSRMPMIIAAGLAAGLLGAAFVGARAKWPRRRLSRISGRKGLRVLADLLAA